MKPETLARSLQSGLSMMCCPRCRAALRTEGASLICAQGHCFDLSRRGYVNLAPGHDQAKEKYGAELFENRAEILNGGFYLAVLDAIREKLGSISSLADIGCGEGYYSRMLAAERPDMVIFGMDISRDAITAAARSCSAVHWLVADLKHLPLADESVDVLLDVLTPADYAEFRRVLKPGGRLIKVIPGTEYLKEIRQAVSPWLRGGEDYDNTRVMEHLRQNAEILSETPVHTVSPLTEEQSRAFLAMTPMTFSVPAEALERIRLEAITVDMHVLECVMK